MKKVLFFFCFIPVLAFAQRQEWEKAWLSCRPDNLGQPIRQTSTQFSGREGDFYKAGLRSEYQFAVRSDSMYHVIFRDLPADSLPAIDFNAKYLVVYVACPQCLATCRQPGKAWMPCHRNACMFREAWYLLDLPRLPDKFFQDRNK